MKNHLAITFSIPNKVVDDGLLYEDAISLKIGEKEFIPGVILKAMMRNIINVMEEKRKLSNNKKCIWAMEVENIVIDYVDKFLNEALKGTYIEYELRNRLRKLFE